MTLICNIEIEGMFHYFGKRTCLLCSICHEVTVVRDVIFLVIFDLKWVEKHWRG